VFDNLYVPDTMLEKIKQCVRHEIEKENEEALLAKDRTEKQISELKFKKGKLVDLLMDDRIDNDMYNVKVSEYSDRESELKGLLAVHSQIDGDIAEIVDSVADIAGNAGKIFESSQPTVQNQLLRLLLSDSTLTGEKVQYSLQKPFGRLSKTSDRLFWWS